MDASCLASDTNILLYSTQDKEFLSEMMGVSNCTLSILEGGADDNRWIRGGQWASVEVQLSLPT